MNPSPDLTDLAEVDLKIKGVGLGSSYANMKKLLGKPLKTQKVRDYGCYGDELETEMTAFYSGLTIKLLEDDNNKLFIYSIEITSPKISITPDIKLGISPQIMQTKFGIAESVSEEKGFQIFTYINKGNDGTANFYFKNNKLMKIQWMSEIC